MGLLLTACTHGEPAPAKPATATAPDSRPTAQDLGLRVELEPKALELLKAMSTRLAAARTMKFTAVATYESPARTGQPLAYFTRSDVTVQRPNQLRVLTPADGAPSDFYYDGKTMTAFSPASKLVAVAPAPPTIDAMLKAAYDQAAIYFPFADLIVSDPYADIADGLKVAFVVGQSQVVGDTTTDVIAVANDTVQGQLWIGAKDRLPRLFRATFFHEPGNFRHVVVLSNWKLDVPVPPGTFTAAGTAGAVQIPFASPDAKPTQGSKP